MIKIGDKDVKKIYVGDKPVKKVMLGDKQIWPDIPPPPPPVTYEIFEGDYNDINNVGTGYSRIQLPLTKQFSLNSRLTVELSFPNIHWGVYTQTDIGFWWERLSNNYVKMSTIYKGNVSHYSSRLVRELDWLSANETTNWGKLWLVTTSAFSTNMDNSKYFGNFHYKVKIDY